MRRPGVLIGLVFAAGLALGLGASSLFFGIDSSELRTAVGSRLAAQPGPLGDVILDRLDDSGAVDGIASDVRDRQVRNLVLAAVVGAAGAIALGRGFSGWTIQRAASASNVEEHRLEKTAAAHPASVASPPTTTHSSTPTAAPGRAIAGST